MKGIILAINARLKIIKGLTCVHLCIELMHCMRQSWVWTDSSLGTLELIEKLFKTVRVAMIMPSS